MTWYRCRAEVGDGAYVSYIGPSLETARENYDKHVRSRFVTVEIMIEDATALFGMRWKTLYSKTHHKGGTYDQGTSVHGHVDSTRVASGMVDTLEHTGGG